MLTALLIAWVLVTLTLAGLTIWQADRARRAIQELRTTTEQLRLEAERLRLVRTQPRR